MASQDQKPRPQGLDHDTRNISQTTEYPEISIHATAESEKSICLRFVNCDHEEVRSSLSEAQTLHRAKELYAKHVGIPIEELRFILEGVRIRDTDTPKSLSMQNDDIVEVYREQMGG